VAQAHQRPAHEAIICFPLEMRPYDRFDYSLREKSPQGGAGGLTTHLMRKFRPETIICEKNTPLLPPQNVMVGKPSMSEYNTL
jgi:hypothetical protein